MAFRILEPFAHGTVEEMKLKRTLEVVYSFKNFLSTGGRNGAGIRGAGWLQGSNVIWTSGRCPWTHRDSGRMTKSYTSSSQIITHTERCTVETKFPLTEKIFAIHTFWEKRKLVFTNSVPLSIWTIHSMGGPMLWGVAPVVHSSIAFAIVTENRALIDKKTSR